MKASEIYELIHSLSTTPSLNDKKEILKKYKDDSTLIKYLQYTYDEVNFVYGKNKIPECKIGDEEDSNLETFFETFDKLNSGEYRGKKGDELVKEYLDNKKKIYHELFYFTIKRDLKAKVGVRLINEAMGYIIEVSPYMRCESEKYLQKRIKYPALIQTKADGLFCNLIVKKDNFVARTRYGKTIPELDLFVDFHSFMREVNSKYLNSVIHGELLLKDNGRILPREIGNGMVNKFVKSPGTLATLEKKIMGTKSEAKKEKIRKEIEDLTNEINYIKERIIFLVWDLVRYDDWINLESKKKTSERFHNLQELIQDWRSFSNENDRIKVIEYRIVKNAEEAYAFYNEQLQKGEEGAVIKNLDAPWVNDVNRFGLIKMKDFKEADLLITGWKPGDPDSEFKDGIGALICESSCGKVQVEVSGLTHAQRGFQRVDENDSSKGIQLIEGFDPDQYTGKIAAVKFNSLIKARDKTTYSLFLPSLVEIREPGDKNKADDLERIKKL